MAMTMFMTFLWCLGALYVGNTALHVTTTLATDGDIEQATGILQTKDELIKQTTGRNIVKPQQNVWYSAAQTLCPALNLCTKPSLQNISIPAGKQLCCAQCSCDVSCLLYNNCCPDADVTRLESGSPQQPPCRNTQYMSEHKMLDITHYRITDRCPPSFTDMDVIYKCTRNTSDIDTYGDIVTVSSARDHDQIFRNKFCAACNGVYQTVKWVLISYNCDSNPTHLTLRGSEVIAFTLTDCQLYSIPPVHVHLTYKVMCWNIEISRCNLTGQWKTYDPYLEQACQMSVFPVYNKIGGGPKFRNVFCYLCNYPDVTLTTHICKELITTKWNVSPFSVILNLTDKFGTIEEKKIRHRCGEDEMFCPIMGVCRRLYCPAFTYAHFSECRALWKSSTAFGVQVNLKISLNQTCSRKCLVQITDQKMQEAISRILSVDVMSSNECIICFYIIFLPYGSDMNSTNSLAARIELSQNCKYEMIRKRLQVLEDSMASYIVDINGQSIQVAISLDIAAEDTGNIQLERILDRQRNVLKNCMNTIVLPITYKMAYCAHFVFNVSEYRQFVGKVEDFSGSDHKVVPDKDKYLRGFIEMNVKDQECQDCSDNQVYICTDTYFRNYQSRSGETSRHGDYVLIFTMLMVSIQRQYTI